jgi:hypothetical protein
LLASATKSNKAAHQATYNDIGDISDDGWEMTFRTNIHNLGNGGQLHLPNVEFHLFQNLTHRPLG